MFPLIHPGSGSYPLPKIGLLYLAEGPTHGPSAGVFKGETSKKGPGVSTQIRHPIRDRQGRWGQSG